MAVRLSQCGAPAPGSSNATQLETLDCGGLPVRGNGVERALAEPARASGECGRAASCGRQTAWRGEEWNRAAAGGDRCRAEHSDREEVCDHDGRNRSLV